MENVLCNLPPAMPDAVSGVRWRTEPPATLLSSDLRPYRFYLERHCVVRS